MKFIFKIVLSLVTFVAIVLLINKSISQNDDQVTVNKANKFKADYDAKEFEYKDDKTTQVNLNELFHVGMCLLKAAGNEIIRIRKEPQLLNATNKADDSLVTQADLLSNKIIVNTLKEKFSAQHLKVMSEETTDVDMDMVQKYLKECGNYEKKDSDLYMNPSSVIVWIDPLDATQEYSENLVDYVTVMMCIAIDGLPRSGIIHQPFKSKTEWSWVTHQSSLPEPDYSEDTALRRKKPRIIVSRSHTGSAKEEIEKIFPQHEFISAAGSGYKVLELARRNADLYLHTGPIKKWDLCAPNAILNSIEGKMTDINGSLINYSSLNVTVQGVIASRKDFNFYSNKVLKPKVK